MRMTVNEKIVKALKDTLKYLKKQYKNGNNYHNWSGGDCPACILYDRNCKGCVFTKYISSDFEGRQAGCINFFASEWRYDDDSVSFLNIHLEDLASLVYQTLLYFEEEN